MNKLIIAALCMTFGLCMQAQTYVEQLTRGVVAVPSEKGNFISWRLLATDAPGTTFNLMRDGDVIAGGLAAATCFTVIFVNLINMCLGVFCFGFILFGTLGFLGLGW